MRSARCPESAENVLGAAALAAMAGCYEETGNARRPDPAATPTEGETAGAAASGGTAPAPGTVGQGGGSHLGAAKRSAEGVVGDLERRDRELQRQLEEDQ